MKITIFGTGYVGLVQAAVFAEVGHEVCCVDTDITKIEKLNDGIVPIFEPGLSTLIVNNKMAKRIRFTTNADEGVNYADIIFIAVSTPSDEKGAADLTNVNACVIAIADAMTRSKIIINKSTVPIGTADAISEKIQDVLLAREIVLSHSVVSNPEFFKEGTAVIDCMRPDRIVIGIRSEDNNVALTKSTLQTLYAPFNRNHDRIMFMDARSAEFTKYVANSLLATKISFMNEMANIADCVGADIEQVRQGIGADERIGYHFIYPGCGYGGSCFPKDLQAIINSAGEHRYHAQILQAVESVNQQQKNKLFDLIKQHFNGKLSGKVFALWGLSYKPGTNDMRQAPSRTLMQALWQAGAKVQAWDPVAMNECQYLYGPRQDLVLARSKEDALDNADALVICTEWQNFKAPDFKDISLRLQHKVVFDGRNLFTEQNLHDFDLTYYSIGRPVYTPKQQQSLNLD